MVGTLILVSAINCNAQSIGDILGNIGKSGSGNSGGILTSVIEGVFSKSNLNISDLVGEYTSQGPAVAFKSESLLQKAGGIAATAKIESELNPYYQKYGLDGMTLTIDYEANFTMKIKGISLKGIIVKDDSDGTFDFKFNVMGINLGSFKSYIEKSGSTLKVMFDATKLKNFISTVAKFTGNSMATAVGSLLDSYEGTCIGFRMVSTAQNNTTNGDAVSNGLGTLKDILNKGK